MSRRWEHIGDAVVRHRGAVLAVSLVISLVLAAGTSRLTFATGQDSYLNRDSQVAIDNEQYQSLFGGQAMITVIEAEPGNDVLGLFTADNRAELAALAEDLDAIPGVLATATPLTAMDWNQALVAPAEGSTDPTTSVASAILLSAANRETDPAAQAARLDDAAASLTRLTAAGPQTYDNPEWVEVLLLDNAGDIREALRPFFPTPPGVEPSFANATRAQIVIRFDGNQTSDEEGATTEAVTATLDRVTLDGFTTFTTGAPALLKDINDNLMGGMLVLGAIAVAVMVLVLSLVFRVRWRLVPLVVMAMGVLWTFGLLGYAGFQLSIVTIAGLPILIGLGVEFAIQVQNRVEEEIVHPRVTLTHGARPVPTALARIGPPLLVATTAAVIACLALRASATPMIREFGVLLAVGIVFVFLAAVVVPAALLAFREHRRPTTRDHRQPVVESMMTRLGHLPPRLVPPLVLVALALFVGGLFAEHATPIQTDPNRWVDQSSQVIQDIDAMQAATGASSELGVYLRDPDGVFTDEMSEFVTTFASDVLERHPGDLTSVSSLPTTVASLMAVPGGTDLAPTGDDLRLAYDVAPVDLQASMVADGDTAANVVFQTGPSTLEVRKAVTEDIRAEVVPPAGISATPSGLAVIGVGLLDNLTSNRLLLVALALGGVFLWFLLRLRSPVNALIVMLPILFAVGLSATVVWLVGITVSPLSTVGSPLVIAVCGEFASLILFRHLEERSEGLEPREAIDVAAARTGRAFFASSLTTVGGFAVLLISPLPLLRDFGAIVAITIAIALLSAMTVLPPLLVWADERGILRLRRPPPPIAAADQPKSPSDRSREAFSCRREDSGRDDVPVADARGGGEVPGNVPGPARL